MAQLAESLSSTPAPDLLPRNLLHTLRSYSDSTQLSALLQAKLHPSVLSLSGAVTAQCPLLYGYALGQANGHVAVFLPPCSKSASVFEGEEIVALVCLDGCLLAFAGNRFAKVSMDSLEIEAEGEVEGIVSAAALAPGEKQVLVGFSEGLIQDYREDDGDLKRAANSYQGEGTISHIETVAGQNWFFACGSGGQPHFFIWRYGSIAPLYKLTPTYGVNVVPSSLETETLLPMKRYREVVEQGKIAFLVLQEKASFEDSFTLAVHKDGTATIVEQTKLDHIYYRCEAEDKAVFRYGDSVVILGTPEPWLKHELVSDPKLRNSVLYADIGLEYTTTGVSECGLYQFLISDTQVQALFLGAVETTFTHAYSHNDSHLSTSSVLHRRFSTLCNALGAPLQDLDPERSYSFSPDLTYCYSYTRQKTDWQLVWLEDGSIRHKSPEVPIPVFSPIDQTVVLIYSTYVSILGLHYITQETVNRTIDVGGLGDSKLFWKPGKWLFAFRQGVVAKAVKLDESPREVQLPLEWEFECLTDVTVNSLDFVVGYKDRCVYYTWTEENLIETAVHRGAYSDLKVFGNGKYCAVTSDRRYHVFTLPQLVPIMSFRLHSRLGFSPVSDTFFTYSKEPGRYFLSPTTWNLALGIPTSTLDLGLSLIPSLPDFDQFDRHPQYIPTIERLWRVPILEVGPYTDTLIFLGVEYLPAYCCAVYQIAQLLSKGTKAPLTDLATRLVIYPCQINVLHLFVYQNQSELVSEAMAKGAKFLKSHYGTPISLCLTEEQAAAREDCLDQLLDGLITLSDSCPKEYIEVLNRLDDDFPLLLQCDSAFLPSFLQTILVPLPKEFIYRHEAQVGSILPLPDLWPDLKPHPPRCRLAQWYNCFASTTVPVLRVCPIPLSMELRKDQLLDVLKGLDASTDILGQEMIKSLASAKWREISLVMKLWTLLYWMMLVLVVERIYGYGEETKVQIGLLVLNALLLIIEIWQAATGVFSEYLSDPWNWADWVRFSLTYMWTFASPSLALTFPTVIFNAFIGLTTFEAFSQTRFLVRMILKVCINTIYFVLLFVYSNITFGVLCAVTEEGAELSFYESWTTAFEMSMGGFDNTNASTLRWFVFFVACVVNMVWLLNLIVSLLGTSYDDFTTVVLAEDVKAQFERVFQLESMVKCVFSAQGQHYLQVYSTKPPSCNPREEQVTLYSLRQEMQAQLQVLREGMKVLLAKSASQG